MRRVHPLHMLTPVCLATILGLGIPSSAAALGHMTYHGGPVMHASTTYAIYWLPAGRHFEPDGNDALFEGQVEQFLKDVGGTPYYNVLTQYSKDESGNVVQNGPIQNQSTFGGSWVDTTPYPHAGTQSDPLKGSDFLSAVKRSFSARGWMPSLNAMFFVFTAANVEVCDLPHTFSPTEYPDKSYCTYTGPADVAPFAYCSDRDYAMEGTNPILYAQIPEPANCAEQLSTAPPGQDLNTANAIARVDFNFVESVVDPLAKGWYSNQLAGGEVADGCAKMTPTSNLALHGHTYTLPALWSNAQDTCIYYYPPPRASASLRAKMLRPNQKQTLHITTVPAAHIVVTVSYHDGTTRYRRGQSDASGRYGYTWRVPKIRGRVDVQIEVSTDDGGHASLTRHFRIR